MNKLCAVIFVSVLLSGCSVATKYIITNLSGDDIEIIATDGTKNSSEVTIIPSGESRKFQALEYGGFTLKQSDGNNISYRRSIKKFKSDWQKYRGTYICNGPKVNLEFRASLVALHCSEEGKSMKVEPDEFNNQNS